MISLTSLSSSQRLSYLGRARRQREFPDSILVEFVQRILVIECHGTFDQHESAIVKN
jgi:hypothetical protein